MARPVAVLVLLLAAASALFLVALADGGGRKPGKPSKAKCGNKNARFCYNIPIECPACCPHNCFINCKTCSPVCRCNVPGAICQDPRFVGADGITFYFHGKKDSDFCLVSDADLHINGHFIGRRGADMTRDFTWVQSIGVLFGEHRLYLGAEKAATWDDDVDRLIIAFDGETVALSDSDDAQWSSTSSPAVSVIRTASTNSVDVEVEGLFKVAAKAVPITEEESQIHRYGITADDCFAHLELAFQFYSLTNDVHGVLGQTYREDYISGVKMSSAMPIMGGDAMYAARSLFSADCAVARFAGSGAGLSRATVGPERPALTCESGVRGNHAIVCKK